MKLLVDPQRLADEAARHAARRPRRPRSSSQSRSEGGAYMLRRRLERQVSGGGGLLADELARQVHARIQDWAVDAVTRPPQNRDLSGHEGDMVLNGAYLVEAERVEGLRALRRPSSRQHHRELGARIELTGPWPPYNFVPRGSWRTDMSTILDRDVALIDVVDRLLGGGVVIAGDITLAVADVDLVYVGLRALVSSVATAEEKQLLARDGERAVIELYAIADHPGPPLRRVAPLRAVPGRRARGGLRAGGAREVTDQRRCGATRRSSRR